MSAASQDMRENRRWIRCSLGTERRLVLQAALYVVGLGRRQFARKKAQQQSTIL